jgi:hypothetical protein
MDDEAFPSATPALVDQLRIYMDLDSNRMKSIVSTPYVNVVKHLDIYDSLLHRPIDGPRAIISKFEILPPRIHLNTASYADMEKYLKWLVDEIVLKRKYRIMILWGDEQFVSRIWHLILKDPYYYGAIVPLPGDLHFLFALTHALYRLGGKHYLIPLAIHMQFLDVKIDFLTKYWDKQEEFMIIVTEGILRWLKDISDKSTVMKNLTVHQLLTRVQDNKKVIYFLIFSGGIV